MTTCHFVSSLFYFFNRDVMCFEWLMYFCFFCSPISKFTFYSRVNEISLLQIMACAASPKLCATCETLNNEQKRQTGILLCIGCQKSFCSQHIIQHRRAVILFRKVTHSCIAQGHQTHHHPIPTHAIEFYGIPANSCIG
jgi:hypothetical protein